MMRIVPALLLVLGLARADVDNLRFLGHNEVNRNHEMDAEIVGNRAFIACGFNQGVECYDISDPASPQRTWLSNGPNCWRLRAYGDTWLFAFCRREGVVLYDISDPDTAVMLGQYDPPGNREALEGGALVGSMLYAAAHQNGIYAIDFSNPASPQKVGALSLEPSQAWNVEARDSFLLIANGRHGLAAVGLEGGMHVTSRLELPGCANDIVLDGEIAVMSLGADGLATVRVMNPYNPILYDTIATGGCAWGIGSTGHLVMCGSWRVMEAFDVSDPLSIQRVGWDNTYTWAHGVDIRGKNGDANRFLGRPHLADASRVGAVRSPLTAVSCEVARSPSRDRSVPQRLERPGLPQPGGRCRHLLLRPGAGWRQAGQEGRAGGVGPASRTSSRAARPTGHLCPDVGRCG
jgi:hypothetical protein